MIWERVTKFDRRAVALADRHYSRQQPGTPQFLPPGQTLVLLAPAVLWALCRNLAPGKGSGIQFRCAIFRNESDARASDLIRSALETSRALWVERYGAWPVERLTSEIDPDRVKPSRTPGHCFKKAGWERLPDRRGLVIYGAP
ncbi:MAG TPA: hypothetical protein VFA31_09540 [Candidatus Polarisedimenticolia bacterium]|nr:hypothetical protein [Candidatus Polarisedimenticolia bacterium]